MPSAKDALYVNLFIASELSVPETGLTLRQETTFPDEERTQLTLKLKNPATFTLYLRHPVWVASGAFAVKVNGEPISVESSPSSYAQIRREWKDGDRLEIQLPMTTTAEGLPDGSPWYAILHGPILLASPDGTENMTGLRAGAGRGDHIAEGPLIPLDKMPALLSSAADLPKHVVSDPAAGPLHFRLVDVSVPESKGGLPLEPFFRLHDSRYQMYWEVTTRDGLAARQEKLAADEGAKLARDAATIDFVAVGEQQSEVDHAFEREGADTGMFNGRRWRHGKWFQYTLNLHGAQAADLAVTYSGGDRGRNFDILVNGKLLATEHLDGSMPGKFVEKRYSLPTDIIAAAPGGAITIRFSATSGLAGGIFDLRLLKPDAPALPPSK